MERLRRGGRHATARTSELPLSRRSDASTPGIGLRQTSGCMKRSSPAPGDDAATRNALLIVSPLLLALVFVAQSAWGGREGVARTESHGTDTEWTWTQMMTALATTGTDQLKLPVALQLARGRRSFETFVVMFTYLASATYHFCDAFDTSLGLTELQWHRLDNVGSIAWASLMGIELGGWAPGMMRDGLQMSSLGVALLAQERAPWNVQYTVWPVVAFCTPSVARWIAVYCGLVRSTTPAARRDALGCFGAAGACAVVAFAMGLDDRADWLRLWHGAWHMLNAVATYYVFRVFVFPGSEQRAALQHPPKSAGSV